MPLVKPEESLKKSENPLVEARVKFAALCQITSLKSAQDDNFNREEWSHYFKRYFQCGLIDKYSRKDLKYYSHCISNLIKGGDVGLEETLMYFEEIGAPLYDYIGTGIFTASIEILAHLAYDIVEYCLVTERLSVGETKKKIMKLGYPQVSTGLAIMWYLEDEKLGLE